MPVCTNFHKMSIESWKPSPECPIPSTCQRILASSRNPVTHGEQKAIADDVFGNAEDVLRCFSSPRTHTCGAVPVLAEAARLYESAERSAKMQRYLGTPEQ